MTPHQRPSRNGHVQPPARMSVIARRPLPDGVLSYAEAKLGKLGRHAHLHDVSMVIDHEPNSTRLSEVEVVAHLHHVRLVAHADGVTVTEAIDRAVDRADRQVLRRKDRVTDRKGHTRADGEVPGPAGEPPGG